MPKTPASSNRPLLPRRQVMVAVANAIDYELRCARDYGVGAEIQTFGFPEYLATDSTPLLRKMIKQVAQLNGPIGCHGPFIDTIHYSTDPDIREVCRIRYLRAFDVAEALGAKYVLFHSQYNPIIRVPIYRSIYHRESLKFWPELVEEAERRKLPIYIENMFDDSPQPAGDVADAINSPYFKLCLDVAHASIHSKLPLQDWISAWAPHLRHVHVNDCMGEMDDHLGLGQGVLDIQGALKQLGKLKIPLTYLLETGKNTVASFRYLNIPKSNQA